MKRELKEQSAKNQPFGLKSDYEMNAAPEPDKVKAGPNQFAMMKDRMQFYGPSNTPRTTGSPAGRH